jgi:hypothetical protein
MTEDEARLTARRLNDSELNDDSEDRWHFTPRHVGNFLFEIVITDNSGNEIARW